jgi:NADH:ubiquinone oxidoreductase subunit F (NADH-binding)
LIIACYASGAACGFIYVRGEHRLGYERFRHESADGVQVSWS